MLRTLCLLFFSMPLLANQVQSQIDEVYHGYKTSVESRAILQQLEAAMPYPTLLDNARVMAFKCWFADASTPSGLQKYSHYLTQAANIIKESGNHALQHNFTACKAHQLYTQGYYDKAKLELSSILTTPYNLDDLSSEMLDTLASAQVIMNRVYLAQGDYQNAFAAAKQAYTLFDRSGNHYERALTLREIADIHITLNNFELAIEQLKRATTELSPFNEQEYYKVTSDLAYAYEKYGDTEKAIQLYASIQQDVKHYENDNGYAYIVLKLAELYTQLDKLNSAYSYLGKAATLKIDDTWMATIHTLTRAQWHLKRQHLDTVSALFAELQTVNQQTWTINLTERYLEFTISYAEASNNSILQSRAQQQLITLLKQKQRDIADNALVSARLSFDLDQQKREITRLEQTAALQQKLLTIADDKAFWQHLTLTIASLCFVLFALYTLKQIRHKKHFEVLALKDELTGIANRRAILNLKQTVMQKSALHGQANSLLSIDIDHFKGVNDQYGHAVGDELIKSVADTLVHTVRSSDVVGRVGGEEFLIVLAGQTLKNAKDIAERIRASIANTHHTSLNINATVSIGVIEIHADESAEEAAKRVDLNLYTAKESGRNSVVV